MRFVELYIPAESRTCDQMVQAARFGVQNIAEGSVDTATSTKLELNLYNVARASLEEPKLDYQDYLRQHGESLWLKDDLLYLEFIKRRIKFKKYVIFTKGVRKVTWLLGLVEFKKCAILIAQSAWYFSGLGLVEFKKCAILIIAFVLHNRMLGLVEFKKCAILFPRCINDLTGLRLVEFKKCAIL